MLDCTFGSRGHGITYLRYLERWAGHDPAHAADMLCALPDLATDPGLRRYRL